MIDIIASLYHQQHITPVNIQTNEPIYDIQQMPVPTIVE